MCHGGPLVPLSAFLPLTCTVLQYSALKKPVRITETTLQRQLHNGNTVQSSVQAQNPVLVQMLRQDYEKEI